MYEFLFRARGTSLDGEPVKREATLSKYVRPASQLPVEARDCLPPPDCSNCHQVRSIGNDRTWSRHTEGRPTMGCSRRCSAARLNPNVEAVGQALLHGVSACEVA